MNIRFAAIPPSLDTTCTSGESSPFFVEEGRRQRYELRITNYELRMNNLPSALTEKRVKRELSTILEIKFI